MFLVLQAALVFLLISQDQYVQRFHWIYFLLFKKVFSNFETKWYAQNQSLWKFQLRPFEFPLLILRPSGIRIMLQRRVFFGYDIIGSFLLRTVAASQLLGWYLFFEKCRYNFKHFPNTPMPLALIFYIK